MVRQGRGKHIVDKFKRLQARRVLATFLHRMHGSRSVGAYRKKRELVEAKE
jgi:hypothetical protein